MKLLVYDIEASNLSADFGIILCVGFKVIGEKRTEVLSLLDYDEPDLLKAEKSLLRDVRERLLDADCWIAHYGRWFDTVYINSRLLYHGLATLPVNFPLIDTWKTCKNHLKLRNNRLVTLQEFLKLENEKNAIKPEQWLRALSGHRRSMAYIVEHCRRDVEVLAEVYNRIRPLISDHPNHNTVTKDGTCPTCGSGHVQKRGYHLTRTRRYQRFHCQECGSWSKSRQPDRVASRAA